MGDAASPSALRGAALQAIASLQKVVAEVTGELERITRVIDATATPEALASDPENPDQMRRTLTVARSELAAAREALAPFAHAWSRKMELIADTKVDVFVDPMRPEKTRSITLRDLQRAARALQTMTVGVDLLDRLYAAEGLLRQFVELRDWTVRGGPTYPELLARLANISNESKQHLDQHAQPGPALPDEPEEPDD